ncbi:HD domain-containing protein [Limibacter armeniacum]|uniref:HD domain-containing protein n=1 Tax=Limibacter armeniacum TaxID=466084 RepID=UPI002FE6385D
MKKEITAIRNFLKESEKLKFELRHSYLSNGRVESVAEHCWQLSLLAMMITPYLKVQVDTLRLLKMIVVHDLVEIYATDIPLTESLSNPEIKKQKELNEKKAMEKIQTLLPKLIGEEVFDLWNDYENYLSNEAKVAHALDKMEAQAQHNDAGADTWEPAEYRFAFMLERYADIDPALMQLADLLSEEAEQMLIAKGVDVAQVKAQIK